MGTQFSFRKALSLAGCGALFASSLYAQVNPAVNPDTKDELIQRLLTRMEALEAEVRELKQSAAQKTTPPAVAAPEPAAEAAHEPLTASLPADPPSQPPMGGLGDRVRIHAYADVGYNRNMQGDSLKRFAAGELVLFSTVRLTPKMTALVETNLRTNDAIQVAQVPLDMERLLLQYRFNDYFTAEAGQYRTAIGYYSTAYLRGSWFQTAITRPRLFEFEDSNGFLPLHNVGVTFSGRIPSGPLGLRYAVETGNSRNFGALRNLGSDTNFNSHGALNLALSARPKAIPGLDVGFSAYRDRFSPAKGYEFARSVWTAHVVYTANRIEFLNEGVVARYRDEPRSARALIPGFYSQLGYRIGPNWGPYFRVEKIGLQTSGYFSDYANSIMPWRSAYTTGVRYDWSDNVALKFELGREQTALQPAYMRAAAQIAFGF